MLDLGRSAVRLSWGLSLLNLQQLARLCAMGREAPAARSLDAVTAAARRQLGDVLGPLFESVDDLQREWVDLAFDLLSPRTLLSSAFWRAGAQVLAGALAPGELCLPDRKGRLAWQELLHKLHVYRRVRGVEARPRVRAGVSWAELVAEAYQLDAFDALFELEGIGHDLAKAAWRSSQPPRGLFTGLAPRLPAESLVLLHAGMGMSFAYHLCEPLTPQDNPTAVDAALAEFIALCRGNCAPGYAAAALEPLGLVVRTFFPRLGGIVDRRLRRIDAEALRYFWHGAGRALYFLPAHILPPHGALQRAVALCEREAPDPQSRLDALDGLFYAATMVNLRSPEVIEELLLQADGCLPDLAPFASGCAAAVVIRNETTPDDLAVRALASHAPGQADGRRAALWESWVRRPCSEDLAHLAPRLRAEQRFAELARHRPVHERARGGRR